MSNVTLFAIGSIVFIFLTWATLMFLYLRFNDVYRSDQADAAAPGDENGGNVELLREPERRSA